MAEVDRDIGELKAEVRTLRETVSEMRTDLKQMREEFAQVRGGWKVVIAMSALAGAGLSWVTGYVFKH